MTLLRPCRRRGHGPALPASVLAVSGFGATLVLILVAHGGAGLRARELASDAAELASALAVESPPPDASAGCRFVALPAWPWARYALREEGEARRWEARAPGDEGAPGPLLFAVTEHPVIDAVRDLWLVPRDARAPIPDSGSEALLPAFVKAAPLPGTVSATHRAAVTQPRRHVSWRRVRRGPFVGEVQVAVPSRWGTALWSFDITEVGRGQMGAILRAFDTVVLRRARPGEPSRACGGGADADLDQRQREYWPGERANVAEWIRGSL